MNSAQQMQDSGARLFTWTAGVASWKVAVGLGQLKLQYGFRTYQMPADAITAFAIVPHAGDLRELVIAYELAPGQGKTVRSYADADAADFDAFVAHLAALRPAADKRHLPVAEALAAMKVMNTAKLMPFMLATVVTLVVAVLGSPLLLHGLDSGEQEVDSQQLSAPLTSPTRNLLLRGQLAPDHAIKETTTRKGRSTSKYFVPVVTEGWTQQDPVYAVLRLDDRTPEEFEKLLAAPSYRVVVRNILWEGLGSSTRQFFVDKLAVRLAPEVVMLDLREGTPDLTVYLIMVAGTAAIVGGLAVFTALRRKS